MSLIDSILNNDLSTAKSLFENKVKQIFEEKLDNLKLRLVAENFDNDTFIPEANVIRIGRTKLVRVRVRKGKVQRRKKLSAVKGYTIRGGRMVRMTPLERMHRRRGARRAKIKFRGKKSQILRKRKISLRKRRALGL